MHDPLRRLMRERTDFRDEELIDSTDAASWTRSLDIRTASWVVLKEYNSQDIEAFQREAWAGLQLHHANVVSVVGIVPPSYESFPVVVLEYRRGSTLDKRFEIGEMDATTRCTIIRDLFCALVYLHDAAWVHGCVACKQIYVGDDGVTRLANIDGGGDAAASAPTAAPEVLGGSMPVAASDVFSLGCVLFEIAMGKRVFFGGDTLGLIERIVGEGGGRAWMPASVSVLLGNVILRCWAADPAARPTTAEVFLVLDNAGWALMDGCDVECVRCDGDRRRQLERPLLRAQLAAVQAELGAKSQEVTGLRAQLASNVTQLVELRMLMEEQERELSLLRSRGGLITKVVARPCRPKPAVLPGGSGRMDPLNKHEFFKACGVRNIERIAAAIAAGFDVDTQGEENRKAGLHIGAERDLGEVVELLLRAGANPGLRNAKGETPYGTAQRRGSQSVLAVLCSFGIEE